MRMRRLGWAGVEIECDGETLVIDYVRDKTPMAPMLRSPDEPFPPSSNAGGTAAALLTHLHADHADADALDVALRPGAPVFRPEPATGTSDDTELTAIGEEKFTHHTLATEIVGLWAERDVGPFRMISAPAVDGFGDPQHSWIVECDGRRIIHAGDTLFHGYWWRIAHRFGGFDVTFFPINAPVCQWPHLQPASPIEATMMPEEAAVAANIIHAKMIFADPLRLAEQGTDLRRDAQRHPARPRQGGRVWHRRGDPGARRMVRAGLIHRRGQADDATVAIRARLCPGRSTKAYARKAHHVATAAAARRHACRPTHQPAG